MKAVNFSYHAPATVEAACATLAARDDNAKIMGGSQSLGPMLNLRLVRPDSIFDISGVPELKTVGIADNRVRIGAAVTHAQIEDCHFPQLQHPMLATVARGIAYRAIRNRGTIGGSLAHADPAADWVVILTTLGADIELISSQKKRLVPMSDFMVAAYTTVLEKGEIIAAVHVPIFTPSARWAYHKLCRKTGEFSEASAAAYFDPSTCFGRIVLGALDGAPQVLGALTKDIAARGKKALTTEAVMAAVSEVTPGKDAIDRKLYCTAVVRCLEKLLD
ncbi:MAG TPA: FAD binding domain-containing protein [Herbaspirillum sp.]|jgi:carbon-monoxide dehydrogenase medium subunit